MAVTKKAPRILIVHRDAEWVGKAKERLLQMGCSVTDCLELEWAPDLLGGSRSFDLAAISSELDAGSQASIMKAMREGGVATKLLLLLDDLDSASLPLRGRTGILTHRISMGIQEFALTVAAQVGLPSRK